MIQNIINKSILAQKTANNSSSLVFTEIPSQASVLLFQFVAAKCSVLSSLPILRFSTNGGASFISTGYQSGVYPILYNGSSLGAAQTTDTGCVTGPLSGNANGIMSGFVYIYNFNNSTNFPHGTGLGFVYDAANTFRGQSVFSLPGTTGVNAFSFQFLSGTIVSGSFQVYLVL